MPHTNLKKLAMVLAVAGFAGVLVTPLSAQ